MPGHVSVPCCDPIFHLNKSLSSKPYKHSMNKSFGLYYNRKWYSLDFIGKIEDENDILSNLDINILNNFCLIPILGIKDINKDDPAPEDQSSPEEQFGSGLEGQDETGRNMAFQSFNTKRYIYLYEKENTKEYSNNMGDNRNSSIVAKSNRS